MSNFLWDILLELTGVDAALMQVVTFVSFWGFIISAVQAFFGYKLVRLWIIIEGMLLGLIIGPILSVLIFGNDVFQAPQFILIFALLFAILGGWLANKLWKVGVFIVCFWPCYAVTFLLLLIAGDPSVAFFIAFIVGIIGGVVGVMYEKPAIILVSSIANGFSAGLWISNVSDQGLGFITGAVCAVGGMIFQCYTNGNVFGIGRRPQSTAGYVPYQNSYPGPSPVQDRTGMAAAADSRPATPEVRLSAAGAYTKTTPAVNVSSTKPVGPLNSSKQRGGLTSSRIRVRNDREYYFPGAPFVIPQMQIADIDADGSLGLFMSFQNIAGGKRIIALYIDIVCYNVLKEKIAELGSTAILDLSIETGEVARPVEPIALPDKTIRRVEIIPEHVIFSDDSMWSYNGRESFFMTDEQPENILASDPEYGKLLEADILRRTGETPAIYKYMPVDNGTFWMCGCGQLNTEDSCIFCGVKKETIFELYSSENIKALVEAKRAKDEKERADREREEAERQRRKEERDAEIKRRIEDIKGKTKSVISVASEKGKAVLEKAEEASRTVELKAGEEAKAGLMKKAEELNSDNPLLTCQKCGHRFLPGDRFCFNCGAELPGDLNICQSCGLVNNKNSLFCVNCGNKLSRDPGEN